MFAIQDEVTQTIASQLGGFHGGRCAPDARPPDVSPLRASKLYDLYVLGLGAKALVHEGRRRQGSGVLFIKALAIDPTYARAYYGLAQTYGIEAKTIRWRPWRDASDDWRDFIKKAIALDPSDSGAHSEFALLVSVWATPLIRSLQIDEAIALNPNDADALAICGGTLAISWTTGARVRVDGAGCQTQSSLPDWHSTR